MWSEPKNIFRPYVIWSSGDIRVASSTCIHRAWAWSWCWWRWRRRCSRSHPHSRPRATWTSPSTCWGQSFVCKKQRMDVLDILWKWRVFWGKHTSGGFCFLSANIWGVGQKITRLHHGICPPSFRENTTHPQANYAPHPSLRILDHVRRHKWVTFLLVVLEMDLKDKDSPPATNNCYWALKSPKKC